MFERKNINVKGINYLCLALYAFAGMGIEAIYAFLLEPIIYGHQMADWNVGQNIIHWIITCITWGCAHIFTKGSISVGLLSALGGFTYGIVYLLVNRDIKKTFPI